jgi:hypothetical protein
MNSVGLVSAFDVVIAVVTVDYSHRSLLLQLIQYRKYPPLLSRDLRIRQFNQRCASERKVQSCAYRIREKLPESM